MELRSLDLNSLHNLYHTRMTYDFPSDELMPWKWMENLVQEGHQESLGFYDQKGLAAYAILIRQGAGASWQLLNYFAVEPGRRNRGIGSQCLEMLRESLAGSERVILFEVESPEAVSSREEATQRRRRISFYLHCGARPTGVDSWLFGVDYHIMLLAAPERKEIPDGNQVAAAMDRLYHIVVSEGPGSDFTFSEVCRVRGPAPDRQPAPAPEPSQFSRELGQALTYLGRSRKKFMGEKLRDLGFTGAMYMLLLHVNRNPGVSQDHVSTRMCLDKCTVARHCKRLEDMGYLRRETDPNDRRQNQLFLTDKGQEIMPSIQRYLAQWVDGVTAGMTADEKSSLRSLLIRMTEQDKGNERQK